MTTGLRLGIVYITVKSLFLSVKLYLLNLWHLLQTRNRACVLKTLTKEARWGKEGCVGALFFKTVACLDCAVCCRKCFILICRLMVWLSFMKTCFLSLVLTSPASPLESAGGPQLQQAAPSPHNGQPVTCTRVIVSHQPPVNMDR